MMGSTYTVWVVWKANRLAQPSSAIYAGAGPIGTQYSVTSLQAVSLSADA